METFVLYSFAFNLEITFSFDSLDKWTELKVLPHVAMLHTQDGTF